MPELIQVCEEAARAGGAVLQDWVGRFSARQKAPQDFVSEADLASQVRIAEIIAHYFPDHVFVGEEEQAGVSHSRKKPGEIHWIADPLDGTANYVRGIPHYAVSIGVEQDGILLAGVIYDPVLDECYSAVAGGGAFFNGVPMRASQAKTLYDALLAASFPPRVSPDLPVIKEFVAFVPQCQGIRRGGSAALNLAYVAAGKYDGYWAEDLHPWDAAAGVLLVQEAGGMVTGIQGETFDPWNPKLIACATKNLHDEMLETIMRNR